MSRDSYRNDHREQSQWSGDDNRDLSPDAECVHCEEEFPRDQLNERGFCHECESRWDEKSPNYDPGDMEPNGEAWSGGFAENH